MKFIHLGDLHLGKTLSEFDLYEDQKYMIGEILRIAEEEKADAVLIAGDIYDRANPGDQAMNLLDDLLTRCADQNLTVYAISGNHDSDDKLHFASNFMAKRGVHIYSVFDGTAHKEVFEDEHGTVAIYLLPFVRASQVRYFYPEEEIDTYEDAVRVVLNQSGVDPKERNVILAHQFVAGKGENAMPALGGSESPSVKNVGNVERIGYTLFDSFDYAALGHIHVPQKIGRDTVRYCGSPLKYSLSEAADQKSIPVVTLKEKGEVEMKLVPFKPLRDLRHIKGTKEQLLSHVTDPDDYIYVTLTDEDIVDNAMSIFQQYYPNTIKIDYDNTHTKEIDFAPADFSEEHKSLETLLAEFYEQMYGCPITEEEMLVMKKAAKEAGVSDEAD